MPTPSTSVISENSRLEIISKKHDLSRKRVTIFHVTNHPQVFCVARELGYRMYKSELQCCFEYHEDGGSNLFRNAGSNYQSRRHHNPLIRLQFSTHTSTFALGKKKTCTVKMGMRQVSTLSHIFDNLHFCILNQTG